MTVRFECRCGQKLKAPDDKIGKKVLCPGCGSPVPVPDSAPALALPKAKPAAAEAKSSKSGSAEIAMQMLRGATTKDDPYGKGTKGAFTFDEGPAAKKGRKEPKEPSETLDNAKSFLFVVVPGLAVVIVLAAAGYWLSWWVTVGPPERPPLEEVTGIVTLDGSPLAGATVRFLPRKNHADPSRGSSSDAVTGPDGRFELRYSKDAMGAVLGPHLVQIIAFDEDNQPLPQEYNRKTKLSAEVTEGGDNDFEFALTSEEE